MEQATRCSKHAPSSPLLLMKPRNTQQGKARQGKAVPLLEANVEEHEPSAPTVRTSFPLLAPGSPPLPRPLRPPASVPLPDQAPLHLDLPAPPRRSSFFPSPSRAPPPRRRSSASWWPAGCCCCRRRRRCPHRLLHPSQTRTPRERERERDRA